MHDYKLDIFNAANTVLQGLEYADVAPSDAFCDYCIPCFKFAKILRKSPAAIAAEAAASIAVDGMTVEALNGYLNFTIERGAFVKNAFFGKLGEYKPLVGKTVCMICLPRAPPDGGGHKSSRRFRNAVRRTYFGV